MRIGVDIVENSRIYRLYNLYNQRFIQKMLSSREEELWRKRGGRRSFLTGRWAAKEAIGKALGIGLACGMPNIEVLADDNGRPYVVLRGQALEVMKQKKLNKIEVSLSHERQYTIAFVFIE